MGLIRIILALSVVIGHTTPIAGVRLLDHHFAVNCFYIISGFYMQLVLSDKYAGKRSVFLFYSNRFLRLYPLYLLVFGGCWGWVLWKYLTSGSMPSQLWVTGFSELPTMAAVAVAISNISMVGLDVLRLITFQRGSGSFVLGEGGANDMPLSDLVTIDPAWSIGLELWFYIIAPLLARSRNVVLFVVVLLSAVTALGSQSWIGVDPYWLFPAQLWLFVIGMFVCRIRDGSMSLERLSSLRWLFVAVFVALCAAYDGIHKDWRNPLCLVCLCAILPAVFGVSKEGRIDRWIGNLSYGVYLVHWPVNFLMKGHGGENRGMIVCAATFVLVIGIHYFVEEPIDRWRQRRARGINRATC